MRACLRATTRCGSVTHPTQEEIRMKRFHVHLGVADLDKSVHFYSGLFGAPPTVRKDDYAKWMIDDPRFNFAISTREPQGIAWEGYHTLAEVRYFNSNQADDTAESTCCTAAHTAVEQSQAKPPSRATARCCG